MSDSSNDSDNSSMADDKPSYTCAVENENLIPSSSQTMYNSNKSGEQTHHNSTLYLNTLVVYKSDDNSSSDIHITQDVDGCGSKKKKGDHDSPKLKKYKREFLSFMDEHPSNLIHHINCLLDAEDFVPNLVGGNLPQSDQGDRD